MVAYGITFLFINLMSLKHPHPLVSYAEWVFNRKRSALFVVVLRFVCFVYSFFKKRRKWFWFSILRYIIYIIYIVKYYIIYIIKNIFYKSDILFLFP